MHRLELGLPRQRQRQGSQDDAQSVCAARAARIGRTTNAGPDRATCEHGRHVYGVKPTARGRVPEQTKPTDRIPTEPAEEFIPCSSRCTK